MKRIRSFGFRLRRGFTLMELAIVLILIAMVAASIWVAADHLWNNYHVNRANQQMIKVVQNIRDYYTSCQELPPAACNATAAATGNITAALDNLSLFPPEMRRNPAVAGGAIDNPFNASIAGGSLQVLSIACPVGASSTVCFRIQMFGLTNAACSAVLTTVAVDDVELGIAQAGAQAGAAQPMPTGTANPASLISSSQAQTWCNAGGANEVDWDFKLRN